jgi:hypothetical protein
MTENEDSVGDFLINRASDKINTYLQDVGIPAEIGGAFQSFGLLANNSIVKNMLQKSGIKGVFDEKVEGLNRNIAGLKDQIKAVSKKTATVVDEQVNSARNAARPLIEQGQTAVNAARTAEEQARSGLTAATQLPAQAQAAGQDALNQVQAAGQDALEAGQQAIAEAPVLANQPMFDSMISEASRPVPPTPAPTPDAPPAPRAPTNYQVPEEPVSVAPESQELTNLGKNVSTGAKVEGDVGKVSTAIDETSGIPGVGEIGEVFGALLQIGSLIASAFKPHENVQTITTPISGFGFGSMNQYGIGGSSIV